MIIYLNLSISGIVRRLLILLKLCNWLLLTLLEQGQQGPLLITARCGQKSRLYTWSLLTPVELGEGRDSCFCRAGAGVLGPS